MTRFSHVGGWQVWSWFWSVELEAEQYSLTALSALFLCHCPYPDNFYISHMQSSQQFQVLHSRCFTCVDVYLNIPMLHVLGGNEIIKLVCIFFKPGEETYVNALHEYTNKNAHA